MDIHNYKRRLERTFENIKKSKEISNENRKIIIRFHDGCFADGLSICKIERYIYELFRLAKTISKDLDKLTKQDLQSIVAELEKKEWSPHSKQTYKVLLKKFYRWVEGTEEYLEKIKRVKGFLEIRLTKHNLLGRKV